MDKTKLTFYSGLDTVGGVVLEIKYKQARVIMEMGSAFNPSFDLYDGNVIPRKSYVSDGIWTGDIAPIDGLFDREDITNLSLTATEDSEIETAVLCTHLHLDHMRNMGLLSKDIPVYLDAKAQIIEQALQDCGDGVVTLHPNYKDMPEKLIVGEIEVTPIMINCDSYRDYSFYVETPDIHLHYTGDVFVYGLYEQGIRQELQFLKEKNVDILVCEGTSFLPSWLEKTTRYQKQITAQLAPVEGTICEQSFIDSTQQFINSYEGLLIFNYYPREILHARNWFDFAKNSGRTLVFEPKAAHILNRFFNQSYTVLIPDSYDLDNAPAYLKEVIDKNHIIQKETILENPGKYLVQNTYENILELLDYRNIQCTYLHHSGTPLGSYDPQYQKMMAVLERCHIEYKYIYINQQGEFFAHATANQLLWYIQQVSAKLLVPSHCPNRLLEAQLSNSPYYLCENKISYYYDRDLNTLKEVNDEY